MAGFLSIRSRVVPLITTLVGTHVAISLASIARSGMGASIENREDEECFDAKHYDLVTDFVARMYGGRGIKTNQQQTDNKNNKNNNNKNKNNNIGGVVVANGVRLAPTATFEDPAAVCVGEQEIREAFRALRFLKPVSLSPPVCVNVQPKGDSIDLTFRLNQQYTIVSKNLNLLSLLKVRVQLQQMKEVGLLPESEFLVVEMKELWYGNPLMWPYPLFFVSRRLNGLVSYHLTSRFL